MAHYQIAVIVGSLRRDSYNRKLATALMALGPADFTFAELCIGGLPLYNQDDDAKQAEPVVVFKAAVAAAQGVLFVTPEYNRSVPGVLKNAIDHGSRPHGKSAWRGKPAGIIGASPGAVGTAVAQQHLRGILATLAMPALTTPEAFIQVKDGFFDDAGGVNEGSRKFLQGWMDHYVAWVKQFAT